MEKLYLSLNGLWKPHSYIAHGVMSGEEELRHLMAITAYEAKMNFTRLGSSMARVGQLAGIALRVPGVGSGSGPSAAIEGVFAEKFRALSRCTLGWHSFVHWLRNTARAASRENPTQTAEVEALYRKVVQDLGEAGVPEEDVTTPRYEAE